MGVPESPWRSAARKARQWSERAAARRADIIAKQRSEEIDRQIEEDSRKFKKEVKILLLGACGVTHRRAQ